MSLEGIGFPSSLFGIWKGLEMAKLELTLHGKNGYVKTVREDYVSGQKFLDYLNFLDEMANLQETLSPADFFLRKVEFLASLFTTEKVKPEDILKGVNSWELVETVDRLLDVAMGAKGDDPKLENSLSEIVESVS